MEAPAGSNLPRAAPELKEATSSSTHDTTNPHERSPAIGIDLGTTYSYVAVCRNKGVEVIPNDQGNRTTPSWVAYTQYERLIGEGAKNQQASNHCNTIFDAKRMIGRTFSEETVQQDMKLWPFKVVAGPQDKPMVEVMYKNQKKCFCPEEISSVVLSKMKETAEAFLGCEVKDAVITVPANFRDPQREATKDAGRIAGLNVLQIINEPTAAALAYKLDNPNQNLKHVLVFDFGGGTLDVCILAIQGRLIEVKATVGDTHLGGQDIDHNLVLHFAEEFKKKHGEDIKENVNAIRKFRSACERAKRTLSTAVSAPIELNSLYKGTDFYDSINRSMFEHLNYDIFERCMEPLTECLQIAKLTKRDIHEVLLVGGSTRIPKIQELLKEFFDGKNTRSSVHPDEAVACGAAILAAAKSGWKDQQMEEPILEDVTPLSLGIEVEGGIMCNVIKRNTKYPCDAEQAFVTSLDNQQTINFKVYEGERSMAADNLLLGEFDLSGLEPKPAGEVSVNVTFKIDYNGILDVSAREYKTGSKAVFCKTNYKSRLTQKEIEAMIIEASKFRAEDDSRKKAVLEKLKLDNYLFNLKRLMSNKEITSKLEDKKRQNARNCIDDALKWSAENERKADVHQFREKREWIKTVFECLQEALKLAGVALSLYKEYQQLRRG